MGGREAGWLAGWLFGFNGGDVQNRPRPALVPESSHFHLFALFAEAVLNTPFPGARWAASTLEINSGLRRHPSAYGMDFGLSKGQCGCDGQQGWKLQHMSRGNSLGPW